MKIPDEIIDHELVMSFRRLNKSPTELCVTYETSISNLCKEQYQTHKEQFDINLVHREKQPHNGIECYSTFILARNIVEHTMNKSWNIWEVYLIKIFASIYLGLAFVTRY